MNKSGHSGLIFALFQLTKPIITIAVALTALTGFLLCQGIFANGWIKAVLGVYLLSAGSAVINHIQEAIPDSLMVRTQNRPIPSGRVSPAVAGIFSGVLVLAGIILLWLLPQKSPLLLGIFTLFWYNGVYTWLKRKTAFAVVPGSLVGALPPVIGWAAAGCNILQPQILLVAFFFFIGQIPHFWLILLNHGKDYERAGFPTITRIFSNQQIANLTFIWVAATAMAAILPVLFGVIKNSWLAMSVFVMALALLLIFRKWHKSYNQTETISAFIIINVFYLLMMLVFITDALLK